jgi:D-glycero-D-manno-heptose 1,7-bisphosphate phosphatase
VKKNYLYRIEDWEWILGAEEAVEKLKNASYLVMVISNQADITHGE